MMTHELIALALTMLIHVVMVQVAQRKLTRDVGMKANLAPRDEMPPLKDDTERMRRAIDNHVENIGLFISAVVIVVLSGQSSWFTATCAYAFVAARALYAPAYLFGWVPWRSVVYMIGLLATLAMTVAAFV